ncbi:hypothetical protein BHM03_00062824, partial [Ensete ventricosum]
ERQRLVLGDAPVVSAFGWLFRAAMEHSRALRLQECLQGRRSLVPMCRSVSEAGDWGGGRDFAALAKERMSSETTRAIPEGSTASASHSDRRGIDATRNFLVLYPVPAVSSFSNRISCTRKDGERLTPGFFTV